MSYIPTLHKHPNELLRVYLHKVDDLTRREFLVCSIGNFGMFLVDDSINQVCTFIPSEYLLKEHMLLKHVGE